MKKHVGCIAALAAIVGLLAFGGQVMAYTVGGDVSAPGTYTATGSLWTLLNNTDGGFASRNGSHGGDYIIVTGANGATSLISSGEIGFGPALNATISPNSSGGYDLNAGTRSISNIVSIQAYAVAKIPGYPGTGPSYSFTVTGAGLTPTVFGLSPSTGLNNGVAANYYVDQMPNQYTDYYSKGSSSDDVYTGPSIRAILQASGVNTSNLNQYVEIEGADGFNEVLSMGEIDSLYTSIYKGAAYPNQPDIIAWWQDGAYLWSSSGYLRSVLPGGGGSTGLFDKYVWAIDVEPVGTPTPIPASLFFFGPGVAGLAMLRRRFFG